MYWGIHVSIISLPGQLFESNALWPVNPGTLSSFWVRLFRVLSATETEIVRHPETVWSKGAIHSPFVPYPYCSVPAPRRAILQLSKGPWPHRWYGVAHPTTGMLHRLLPLTDRWAFESDCCERGGGGSSEPFHHFPQNYSCGPSMTSVQLSYPL